MSLRPRAGVSRQIVAAVVIAYVLAVPAAAVAAATRSVTGDATVTRTFTGAPAPALQWGTVKIYVIEKITKVGSTIHRRYVNLGGSYTYHTSRSQYIMSQALPLLRLEFLKAQSDNIALITGATLTTDAFELSLQSALLKARK